MSSPSHAVTTKSDLVLRGTALSYLTLMVVLPLAALSVQRCGTRASRRSGKSSPNPFAWHALKLTFATALVMVLINAVMGTATAWVLVRYSFPGKGIMNALIDVPFAVPTVVTGLMLVAALRPDQRPGFVPRPAWLGGDLPAAGHRPGLAVRLVPVRDPERAAGPPGDGPRRREEAAATLGAGAFTTFRRVTFPTLWPAILTGTALAFSRALGEFGSVVMVAGNRPLQTKTGPMYIFGEIESGNPHGAMVVSVVLLASSLGILILLNWMQRQGGPSMAVELDLEVEEKPETEIRTSIPQRRKAKPWGRWLLIGVVVGWFAILVLVPALALVKAALAGGVRPFLEALAAPRRGRRSG